MPSSVDDEANLVGCPAQLMADSPDLSSCYPLGACVRALQAAWMALTVCKPSQWLHPGPGSVRALLTRQMLLPPWLPFHFHFYVVRFTVVTFEHNLSFVRFLKARKNQKMPYGLTVVSTLENGFLLLFACGSQVMWVHNHIWLLFSKQSKRSWCHLPLSNCIVGSMKS